MAKIGELFRLLKHPPPPSGRETRVNRFSSNQEVIAGREGYFEVFSEKEIY